MFAYTQAGDPIDWIAYVRHADHALDLVRWADIADARGHSHGSDFVRRLCGELGQCHRLQDHGELGSSRVGIVILDDEVLAGGLSPLLDEVCAIG